MFILDKYEKHKYELNTGASFIDQRIKCVIYIYTENDGY